MIGKDYIKFRRIAFCAFLIFNLQFAIPHSAFAQTDSTKKLPSYKIAIFAPLYLDSVFTEKNEFRYKQGVPKFILPAVDFVQGAQVALDSMKSVNENIQANIYDSKAYEKNVPWLIQNHKLDSVSLIIGSIKDQEYKQLAEFALQKKIPFVSATYPNDGGITSNPYLVIMNPTLRSHCEAIYSYVLQNHGTDKIYLCRKPGSQEDQVAGYIKQMNEQDGSPLMPITILNFDSDPTSEYLKTKLDSNRKSVIIGASLEEKFATDLASACSELYPTYAVTLLGMPTWDGFAAFHKKDAYLNFPIYFTTSYWNNKWDDYSKILINAYAKKYKGKPSDMAYKGFEAAYYFTKLLTRYSGDMISHINDRSLKIFNEYNFRPVNINKNAFANPDYYENKHLYFIRLLNGAATRAW